MLLATSTSHASGRPLVTKMWDQPQGETVAQRMARTLIALNAEGDATLQRLIEEGFSRTEIAQHEEEARRLATRFFVRQDDSVAPPPYDRQARLADAVRTVRAAMPKADTLLPLLRDRGFDSSEVGDLWAEIITLAADQFAADCGQAVA